MTFVGRPPMRFERIQTAGPFVSGDVADLFRAHDVYVAPSRDDPCSNALLEALACGLPAAFLASGGHPEIVGEGGLPFRTDEELGERARSARRGDRPPSQSDLHAVSLRHRRPLPRGARTRSSRRLRSRPAMANPLRRAREAAAFRLSRRLDLAAVSRAHDVFYASSAWTRCELARKPGAEEPARSVGVPGDHDRDSARVRRRDRDLSGRKRALPGLHLRPPGLRRGRLDRHRAITRGLPGAPSDLLPRRVAPPPIPPSSRRYARASAGVATMIVLDSDHSQAHVEAELAAYAPLVPVGCYLIVEDSNIGQIREDLMPGPLQAIESFLETTATSRSTESARSSCSPSTPRLSAPRSLGSSRRSGRPRSSPPPRP